MLSRTFLTTFSVWIAFLGTSCNSGVSQTGSGSNSDLPGVCSTDGARSLEAQPSPLRTATATADPYAYFVTDVSPKVIQSRCIGCHISGGVAQATPLVYLPSGTPGNEGSNYNLLVNYIGAEPIRAKVMLEKAQGVNHGGGPVLNSNSEEFRILQTFLKAIGGQVDESSQSDFWEGVELASAEQTLRRAALIVARRLPTEAELLSVSTGEDADLRKALHGLMQGEGFHEFLIDGANDRLHLEAFDNGLFLEAADLNGTPLFPLGAKKYFEAGNKQDGWPEWMNDWMRGMAFSPLELIAYIVEHDRSYQEVVTADYMMVNPVMDEILRSGTGLREEHSHRTYRPGKNRGQVLPDDQLKSEFIQDFGNRIESHGSFIDYPHAGVLSTHAFLNRYPTTETNRNRARSRWTYYHFLGVDIEKSATRTTNPVALADTNNPTLRNPACTVCHELLDPVAGAFQNYGNSGLYRDSWGGQDALPETYKHPEWFEENAAPSLYVYGDTWFRDMRAPGFNCEQAPDPSNSLQWLGQRIARDTRFATAAVKFWWPAVMGEEAKTAPEAREDAGFEVELATFNEQNRFIENLGKHFASGIDGGKAYNAKDLFVEMLMSPWFRADSSTVAGNSASRASGLGTRRLLTPEELEAKSRALLGWRWGEDDSPDPWDYDEVWTQLGNRFQIYYGGIDSNGIKERSRALTSLMSNVAEKQAVEMACPAVVLDFNRPDGERLLFDGIDRNTTPTSEVDKVFTVTAGSEEEHTTHTLSGELETGGKLIRISFLNDWYDADEGDRNLHVFSVTAKASSGEVILFTDRDNRTDGSVTFTCSNYQNGLSLWCDDGYISIPLAIQEAGSYTVEVKAWGEQAGPDAVEMSVGVESTDPTSGATQGELAIKNKLIELHEKFLGESLRLGDEELDYSYQLLIETWKDRASQENGRNSAWNWPNEDCRFYSNSHWEEGGPARQANDPHHMLYTWTSMLIYLMTDFYYLHE